MKFLLLLTLVFSSLTALAQKPISVYPFTQGKVELLGNSKNLALRFTMAKGWHVYWKNSGDSGAAPKWDWKLSGARITQEHWPVPERIPVEGMTNFGYEKEAVFLFDIEPDKDVKNIIADLKLEFLICRVECIPYFTELHREIPYTSQTGPPLAGVAKMLYPSATPANLHWQIQKREGSFLLTQLKISDEISKNLKSLVIFPEDGENFSAAVPEMDVDGNVFNIKLPLQDTSKKDFSGTRFLLELEDKSGKKKAFTATLEGDAAGTGLAQILLWAFLGGMILNLMPCVFPVLSIKLLTFVGTDKSRAEVRTSGLFYTLGVLVSFLALGGSLLILRAGGEQIGWGFQLQSPFVAAGIAILFFWLGLNFLGSYEIGQSLSYLGAKKTSHNNWGSFLTGILATVVATPCTAPFMGAALGASLAMPAFYTLLVFAGLGLGMALPFLLLAYFPQGLRFLPKPGAWMEKLKQFLAFPLFATVIWLLWVISNQTSAEALIFLAALFVLIGFWIWFAGNIKNERWKQLLLLLGFALSLGALGALPTEKAAGSASTQDTWVHFQETSVDTDLKAGQAVFIDFTAAWCITCQVNKKVVLQTEEIQKVFSEHKVKLYKADWTDKNPQITAALAKFGRNSLPLYVFYPAGSKKPQLLPEVLTKGIVLDLFNKEEPQ